MNTTSVLEVVFDFIKATLVAIVGLIVLFNNPFSLSKCQICLHRRRDHVWFSQECDADNCLCDDFVDDVKRYMDPLYD